MTAAVMLAAWALALSDQQAQDTTSATPAQASPPAKPADATPSVSGVTVTAAARPDVETSIDRRSYSIAKDLNATTGNMADVLRNLPSVQIDAQGNLSLRGDPNVTVLIDGKPSSQFSSGQVGQALQSMSADRVDRVEVMTNPPPEYQADGSGGVINLITKKSVGAGETGSVRVAAVDKDVYSLTLHGGYNSNKLSLTSDAHFLHTRVTSDRDQIFSSVDPVTGQASFSTDPGLAKSKQNQVDGGLGADYDLTDHDRISASVRGQYVGGNLELTDALQQQDGQGVIDEAFTRFSTQGLILVNGDASLTWKHTYGPGHDLTFNGDYTGYNLRTDRIDDYNPTLPPATADFAEQSLIHRSVSQPEFKADYQQPVSGKGVLKLGYQFDDKVSRQNLAGGAGADPGAISSDPDLTDDFTVAQTDHQAYVSYQQPFDKLTVLAGLRAEAVHMDLDQRTQDVHTTQNYARLYPNLRLTYDLGSGNQLMASYTRRIVRPNIIDLDPFLVSPGPANLIIQGNPNLKPEDISSYEMEFDHHKDADSFQATLYYRNTSDYFTLVADELGTGELLGRSVNAGHLLAGGGELAYSHQITPKLNYNFSVDGYWSEINASNLGMNEIQSLWTGYGRANLVWQITPKDTLQLNAFINGQTLEIQGRTQPTASGNIGYRHVIDPKTTFTFTLQDPFRSLYYREKHTTSDGSVRLIQQVDNRFFIFALVRTFGGGKPAPPPSFDFIPGGTGSGGGGL